MFWKVILPTPPFIVASAVVAVGGEVGRGGHDCACAPLIVRRNGRQIAQAIGIVTSSAG